MSALFIGLVIGFALGYNFYRTYCPERIIFKPASQAPKPPQEPEDAEIVDLISSEVWEECKTWRKQTGGSRAKFFETHYPHLA